ncbi:peptidase S8 and S53 subtilisin kexin sedolisin [Ectopseudomonas mendocina]|uniref:Peptidase S8 and S53 subtilisin kexin sedolisin n=1 Tax=Ectopseudomonas mendocina TaxID=300 RepID=A0A379IQU2_ECTME|nr:S8 family peptidase [Pseudomonas mendocina]SUD38610.1 peptidase S8 and S53 subtilisin kexin sedolisin [Pseudomonas mendocina]
MASPYELPHFRVEQFKVGRPYQRRDLDLSNAASTREEGHGSRLREKLSLALSASATRNGQNGYFSSNISEAPQALYLEVELAADASVPDLNWKTQNIRLSALRVLEDGSTLGALYVPHDAMDFLELKLLEYAEERTDKGKPKNEAKFAPVENFFVGDVETLWTDSRPFPRGMSSTLWWECWCVSSKADQVQRVADRLKLRVSENSLVFPDTEVLLIYANTLEISILVANADGVEELRKATDSPYFFTRLTPREKVEWTTDLASRLIPPRPESPAVCVLDHGVNHSHPLLQPALAAEDCQAVRVEWGVFDHHGHGTNMAGTALYGDLTYALADNSVVDLHSRLESIKFLPPAGWNRNEPSSYGFITQAAVSLAETKEPLRNRVFCMAVSNKDVSGERPTTWSSAIDQICSGSMTGDFDEDGEYGPRRLFIVSAGNIPDSTNPEDVADLYDFPIEDPAQSWNALAVGGFTDKVDLVDQPGYEDWSVVAEAGGHSPYSRASIDWEHSRTPIKPEIVFEAGNKAISPDGTQIISGIPALSILTTGKDVTQRPIEEFWATSSATAQAAGMAAAIMARYPQMWPETVRALIIHSAQWTPVMREKFKGKNKAQCVALARHFGYGVPQLSRALASAQNDLALIAESHIQPFTRALNAQGREAGSPHFNEVHYYNLPWPRAELERLENRKVQLKITLSYFIEPSPGEMAQVIAARYQSFGLRFDLKKKSETEAAFRHRVNKLDSLATKPPQTEADNRWIFGPKSVSAGSVHSDVWIGPAIDLAARDKIAISPVSGWWRYRLHLGKCNTQTRYSLVVSISSEEEDVNLYTEISNIIASTVDTGISIETS